VFRPPYHANIFPDAAAPIEIVMTLQEDASRACRAIVTGSRNYHSNSIGDRPYDLQQKRQQKTRPLGAPGATTCYGKI
jgi:hypothetical protein